MSLISFGTIYIEENYSANKLITWIQVEAINIKEKLPANVKLSLVNGKMFFLNVAHSLCAFYIATILVLILWNIHRVQESVYS